MNFKTIIIVVLVVIALAAVSVAGYIYLSTREKVEPILTHDFSDSIKTNLRDSRQLVVVSFTLEFQGDDIKTLIGERDAQIMDMILATLRSKTPKEIDGIEGQDRLKQELIRGFMRVLDTEKILNIYFKELFVTG